jgi:hypothetical protein
MKKPLLLLLFSLIIIIYIIGYTSTQKKTNIKDVNGDGLSDILIGSPGVSLNGIITTRKTLEVASGEAYLFYGNKNGISNCDFSISQCKPDVTFKGEGGFFGKQLSIIGDINGDGFSDIAIGAHQAGKKKEGLVYIFYGSPNLRENFSSSDADILFYGEESGDGFGWNVKSAGDINGDNFIDIIIGAPYAGPINEGQAYIFLGGKTISNKVIIKDATTIINGAFENDGFGTAVASVGDINNDGFDDFAVTAPLADIDNNLDVGKVYIFNGDKNWAKKNIKYCDLSSKNCTPDSIIIGENSEDFFGYSISTANDVNGDNFDDIVIGAFKYGEGVDGFSVIGRAYIFLGSQEGINNCDMFSKNCISDTTITGGFGDWLGTDVSYAGDVNNDGYSDILIGADLAGYVKGGETYLFFGSPSGIKSCTTNTRFVNFKTTPSDNCFPYAIIRGEYGSDLMGTNNTFVSAGDINGDGFNDILVGSVSIPGYAFSDKELAGRVYLLLGPLNTSSNLSNANTTFTGKYPWSWFGIVR